MSLNPETPHGTIHRRCYGFGDVPISQLPKAEKCFQNLKELTTLSSLWAIVFPYMSP
jgi:hypothetical protein